MSGKGTYVQNEGVQIVQGLGYFNGRAQLVIPRFANFEYGQLVIGMKFLETPPTRKFVALFSNSDICCAEAPSMAIVKSQRNVHYLARCGQNGNVKATTFHLPMRVSNVVKVFPEGLMIDMAS